MLKKLWNDESGAVISAELVLLMTILGIGMVVGLKAVSNSVVTELGDVAAAIGAVDQSYHWKGSKARCAKTFGTSWGDDNDTGDYDLGQPYGENSAGVDVCGVPAYGESAH